MAETPYTQQRNKADRGPQNSTEYNAHLTESYQDLMYLYNKEAQLEVDVDSIVSSTYKQLLAISTQVDQFEDRISALEAGENALVFYSHEQIDNTRFDSTPFAIPETSRNSFHKNYNQLTLPYFADSSLSKIRYINDDGTFNVANGLEVMVEPILTSTDNANAVIDSSSPYDAMQIKPGRVWERNVISTTTGPNGAQCYLYIRIPNELSITGSTNGIMFTPYPVFDVDVLEVSYSTNPNVGLTNAAAWTVLNESDWYINNPEAVGNVAPGAWAGDEILNSGPKLFYFQPRAITAIRLKLQQNSYLEQGARYIYSYGLSNIDVRYDKFATTGKCMIRLDAPAGETISKVDSVQPNIWNVSQAEVNDVFSYRVIYETAFNSGNYTTSPVSLSQRVWLEVTLSQVDSGYTPSVSSIIVNYT